MNLIERIGEIKNSDKSVLGGKAYWLDRLKKLGYTVSEGYCLSKDLFHIFLQENQISLKESIGGNIFKYDEIRGLLYKTPFSDSMQKELLQVYNSLKKPLIVRSSAAAEDSENYSCAGLFTSIGSVNDFETFLNAVKRCWISSFNDTIDICAKREDYAISLLVQEELTCDCGGVAFSMNPITGNVNEVMLENCEEGPKQVVTGAGKIEQRIINKNQIEPGDAWYQRVSVLLPELEEILGTYVDMEWILLNDVLFVLQVRPITTVQELKLPILDVEDERALNMPLNNLLKIHSRWLEKKIPVRKICQKNNINIGRFCYWFRKYDPQGETLEHLVQSLTDNETFEIYDGQKITAVNRENVTKLALASEYNALRISETVTTNYCSFSSIMGDKCYIEVAKGGFTAFYSGEFEVTKYIVDENGIILTAEEKYFEEEYYYSGKAWEKRPLEKQLVQLSHETIIQIVHLTKCLNDNFNNVRAEWILNDKGVYLFDVSVEKGQLTKGYGNTSILSTGTQKGPVRILPDARIFNQYIKHVSVRMGYDLSEIEEKESIVVIKKELNILDGDIIVCEYPNEKLSVLLDTAKGFIFERGSLLCHFAIILRERKIPAVIVPNALSVFKEGQMVEIRNDKVTVL